MRILGDASLEEIMTDLNTMTNILRAQGVDESAIGQLVDCLEKVFGIKTEAEPIES